MRAVMRTEVMIQSQPLDDPLRAWHLHDRVSHTPEEVVDPVPIPHDRTKGHHGKHEQYEPRDDLPQNLPKRMATTTTFRGRTHGVRGFGGDDRHHVLRGRCSGRRQRRFVGDPRGRRGQRHLGARRGQARRDRMGWAAVMGNTRWRRIRRRHRRGCCGFRCCVIRMGRTGIMRNRRGFVRDGGMRTGRR